ncbi:unnamed protein product [Discula destructiva]
MPPKRKAPAEDAPAPPRRSTRARTSTSHASAPVPAAATPKPSKTAAAEKNEKKKGGKKAVNAKDEDEDEAAAAKTQPSTVAAKAEKTNGGGNEEMTGGDRQYWLMKAEPETRLENGVDVSFSIDDLAAKTVPEPWDGIRNYVARNNLRAMKKGDLAFFWHSNCKVPGIAGMMEVVQEHSPDLSAHDPKSAYYDPKSTEADPKWSVVHVEFRRKFKSPVTLKALRGYAGAGGPLAEMQMIKQSRLSVSRVSEAEWEFLMDLAEEGEKDVE